METEEVVLNYSQKVDTWDQAVWNLHELIFSQPQNRMQRGLCSLPQRSFSLNRQGRVKFEFDLDKARLTKKQNLKKILLVKLFIRIHWNFLPQGVDQ